MADLIGEVFEDFAAELRDIEADTRAYGKMSATQRAETDRRKNMLTAILEGREVESDDWLETLKKGDVPTNLAKAMAKAREQTARFRAQRASTATTRAPETKLPPKPQGA